jgi:hypothetical protein
MPLLTEIFKAVKAAQKAGIVPGLVPPSEAPPVPPAQNGAPATAAQGGERAEETEETELSALDELSQRMANGGQVSPEEMARAQAQPAKVTPIRPAESA